MAKIGNWGRYLRFQTSDRRILTFSGMSRTMSMRTVKHQTIGTIPKIEGLDAGIYYLQETKAPSGFIADQRKIKIEIVPTFSQLSL